MYTQSQTPMWRTNGNGKTDNSGARLCKPAVYMSAEFVGIIKELTVLTGQGEWRASSSVFIQDEWVGFLQRTQLVRVCSWSIRGQLRVDEA